ncbi:MAG TPA: GNAT family N-acetyltransferase [Anaeromyxobacteraceae bacterium]|nr:GNAT family N-acetyltransferase [Anaeromyxobacteraceae bacterium]
MRIVVADSPALRAKAYAIRQQVFVEEQRVPVELERDELDDAAVHVVALEGERCVGTGRLVPQAGGVGRVGRMAVAADRRRAGVGDAMLAALEQEARRLRLSEIELHAQSYVERFYARNGYAPEGDHFEEAGIDHVIMRKRL